MGKEAKIGLAVILVLLIVFAGVLYTRISGTPSDPGATAAGGQTGADGQTAEANAPKPVDLSLPDRAPTIVASRSSLDKLPKGSNVADLDDWRVAGDRHDAARSASTNDSSPPSFMPKPAAAPDPPSPADAPAFTADAARYPDLTQQPAGAADPLQSPVQMAQAPGPFTSRILTNSVRNTEPAAGDPFANQAEPNPLRGQAGDPPIPGGAYGYNSGQSRYPSGGGQYQTPDYNNSSYRTYRTPAEPVASQNPYQGGAYGAGSLSRPVDVGQPLAQDGSYVVQPADSYWTISERVYGTGAYYKALAEHNRKRNPDADQLQPGQKILAPSIADLEKNYRDLCPKPEHREIADKRTSMVSPVSHTASGRVYVVQEGDTLFDIAKYELGKAGRWAEIFRLNRNALGDQYDYLTPGMQLVLPSDEPVGRPSEMLTERPGSLLR
jgi:nucleoid-associated protein YgaU